MLTFWNHTQTQHIRYDSPTQVIGSTQIPLPDNTQHSQVTGIHSLMGFKPTILPASEGPQTHALDRTVTGTGKLRVRVGEIDYLNSSKN